MSAGFGAIIPHPLALVNGDDSLVTGIVHWSTSDVDVVVHLQICVEN